MYRRFFIIAGLIIYQHIFIDYMAVIIYQSDNTKIFTYFSRKINWNFNLFNCLKKTCYILFPFFRNVAKYWFYFIDILICLYSICWCLSKSKYTQIILNSLYSYSICWYLSIEYTENNNICATYSYSTCWCLSIIY